MREAAQVPHAVQRLVGGSLQAGQRGSGALQVSSICFICKSGQNEALQHVPALKVDHSR